MVDPDAFRRELEAKGVEWTKKMLNAGSWDEQRNRLAIIFLKEQWQGTAEKAEARWNNNRTFWLGVGVLIGTVVGFAFFS